MSTSQPPFARNPPAEGPARGSTLAWIVPNATVFLSSCCVMVIELVAGRVVSRHLGASLYTWTSVIGVILGGLAVGNYVGGRLADRYAPRRVLGTLFLLSAATCVVIVVANNLVGGWTLLWKLSWPTRVASHVALVFFLPSAILGTIGPVAARMALDLGRRTGYTLGTVYAWGVVGSIVGTFATGYVLISVMGTGAIIWSVAGLLAAVGLCYLPRSPRSWACSALLLVLFALGWIDTGWARSAGEALALRRAVDPTLLYSDDSRYSHIEVRQISESPGMRGFYLDRLLHSQLSEEDPLDLRYGYVEVFAEITRRNSRGKSHLTSMTIGGGGYVFPRYLEATWPGSRIEVVEIDPAVTLAATRAFGLPEETTIESHHADGRVHVNRLLERARRGESVRAYDFIYLDAVNDYSVPFQLTTVEFFEAVRSLLAEEGTLLVNFIDLVESGFLLGALTRTLQEVFPHVAVYTPDDFERLTGRSRVTLVLVASDAAPIDAAAGGGSADLRRLRDEVLHHYTSKTQARVLTDRHAPVESLIAPVVLASATERAAADALARALEQARGGDARSFVALCREALRIEPDFPEAHYNLGVGLFQSGRREEGVSHFRRAVALRPGYTDAQFNLGAALYGSGQLDLAAHHLTLALRLEPDRVAAHDALGVVREAQGDLAGALQHYEEALRLDPTRSQTRGHLGRVRTRISAARVTDPDRGS